MYFRSVGTFARALDCTSTVRQPSLHMSAAAASRDITLVSTLQPLYNTVHYNTVLDITRFKDGSQKMHRLY